MKKIIYIALFLLTTVFLFACDNNYSFSLDAEVNAVRDSITVTYTLNDPDKDLSASEVKAELTKKEDSKLISTQTLKFDKEKKTGSVKFSNLESATKYVITIYAGYDGEKVVLVEKEVTTLAEGADADTPYKITCVEDFTKVLKEDPKGYYVLENDIDFGGTSLDPLFTSTNQFLGHFDGKGHKISNYVVGTIKESENVVTYTKKSIATDYFGLFGYLGIDSVVTNVVLDNFQFHATRASSSKTYYGFIAGYCKGTISNITVTNSVMNISTTGALSEYHVGSIAGQVAGEGSISDCVVECNITVDGKNNVRIGGITASTLTATTQETVSNCSYKGDIDYIVNNTETKAKDETTIYVGGIVGINYLDVKGCSAVGEIVLALSYDNPSKSSVVMVGGLVGWNIGDAAELKDSTADVSINVSNKNKVNETAKVYVGLLVGQNGNDFANAYAIVENCHVVENATKAGIVIAGMDDADIKYGVIAKDTTIDTAEDKATTKSEASVTVEYYHFDKHEETNEDGSVTVTNKLALTKTETVVLK